MKESLSRWTLIGGLLGTTSLLILVVSIKPLNNSFTAEKLFKGNSQAFEKTTIKNTTEKPIKKLLPPPQVDKKANREAEMSVSLDESSDPFTVTISLKYLGKKEIEVYQSSLPWGNHYSMILLAVKADAVGTPLTKYLPVDDPGSLRIKIRPGQTLTGKIKLSRYFENLANARKERDVIVFWSYQLEPIKGPPLNRMGSWLNIPALSHRRKPS